MIISEVITGVAVINGVQGTPGNAVTLSFIATFQLERMEAEHAFGGYEVKDPLGNVVGIVAYDEMGHVTVDLVPSGSTRAAAAAVPVFLQPLSSVIISNVYAGTNFASSSTSVFNGAHVYRGGQRAMMQSGQAMKLTGIKLDIWANAAQNALLNTIVVG